MDYLNFKIDNQDVKRKGIYITKFDWKKFNTSDTNKNIDNSHGRIASPTFVRYRTITIEGIIEKLCNEDDENNLNYLINLFSFQVENLLEVETKELYIKDIYGNEWKIKTKIKELFDWLEGDENMDGSHWTFRVVLESVDSPFLIGVGEKVLQALKGSFGGFSIPFNLDLPFNETYNVFSVNINSMYIVPLRFEIDVKEDIYGEFKIINITTGEYFSIGDHDELLFEAGDKVILDSENQTLTKNGQNILYKRNIGSKWFNLKGNFDFIILDKNWHNYNACDIKIFYSQISL